ncbi:hypothetical protein OT109_15585 [Phycisphaeraceae bacterium D3-23]
MPGLIEDLPPTGPYPVRRDLGQSEAHPQQVLVHRTGVLETHDPAWTDEPAHDALPKPFGFG